jgi:DNA-binding transcriptional ArsR family regulator
MQDHLSNTFAALADPTRRAILARLAMGETSVTELARPFEMSMPAVSKHLKVLENAGLIARGREAQWRPCRLEAGPLKDAAGWIEEYRRFWMPYIDALERHLDRQSNRVDLPNRIDLPTPAEPAKKKKGRGGPKRRHRKGDKK